MKGESTREKAQQDILIFLADRKEQNSGDLVNAFKGKYSKNTIYKYLKELYDEKLLEVELGSRKESFKPKYSLTKRGTQEAERMRLLTNHFDDLGRLSVNELKEELSRYRLISEIRRKQEEHDEEVERNISEAMTLDGSERQRRLDEIIEEEYYRELYLIRNSGLKDADEREKNLKEIQAVWARQKTELASAQSEIERSKIILQHFREIYGGKGRAIMIKGSVKRKVS